MNFVYLHFMLEHYSLFPLQVELILSFCVAYKHDRKLAVAQLVKKYVHI
jgi:hypothetical protein